MLSLINILLYGADDYIAAVYILLRDVEESVMLTTPTGEGDKTFVVTPGTCMVVDMIGLCECTDISRLVAALMNET